MRGVRRTLLLLLVAVLSLGAPVAGTAAATAPPEPSTTAPTQMAPALERDVSECISAVPQPGCGYEPQQAGDRGGWLQWSLFGLMLVGLAFIGWRVVMGVRRAAAAHDA
jgi:hypothetical protein